MRPELETSGTRKRSDANKPFLCRLVLADLKACLDKELPGIRRVFVENHLSRCQECAEEASWLRRLGEDMKDLEQAVPHDRLRVRILASLPEATIRYAQPRSSRPIWLRLAVSGAAASLVMGACFALLQRKNENDARKTYLASSYAVKSTDNLAKTSGVPNAAGSVATPGSRDPSLRLPTDPLTIEADAMIAKQEADLKLHDRNLATSDPESIKRLAQGKIAKETAGGADGKILTVSVPDRSLAQESLIKWAKEVGGQVASPTKSNPNGAVAKIAGVAPNALGGTMPGARDPLPQTDRATLVTLRIPRRSLAYLPAFMKKLGAPDDRKIAGSKPTPAEPLRPLGPTFAPIESLRPMDQQSSRDNGSFVTVMIELQEIHREK